MHVGHSKALTAVLEAAKRQLDGGHIPTVPQLEASLRVLDALVRSGHIAAADAEPLRELITRVIRSL
jgi:hypothetical protein